jgi:SPOR domain
LEGSLSPRLAAFKALVEVIPAEEGAAFIAQAGARGRITSRAGTFEMSVPLTAAAIDKLNATIFPPDLLRSLQLTGRAEFDFVLPGVDGTFTALAGSSPGDRRLDIRRRSAATAAPVPPAAEAAAAPQAISGSYDQADLASLEFPPRSGDADLSTLTVPNDIFGRPPGGALTDFGPLTVPDDIFDEPADGALTEFLDGGRGQTDTPELVVADSARVLAVLGFGRPARRWFPLALAVALCLVAALLVARRFGAAQPPSASQAAAPQPSLAARPSPPPAVSAPPPASPAPQEQTAHAAVPQTPSLSPAAPSVAPAVPSAVPTVAPAVPTVAPAAPAVAPTVRSEGPSRRGFSVQVAAVKTQDEAGRMVTRFVSQGYPAYFVRGEGASANFYRVRVGTFPDRESAERAAKQLEGTEGIKPWIVKESPENKTAASPMPPREAHSNRPSAPVTSIESPHPVDWRGGCFASV